MQKSIVQNYRMSHGLEFGYIDFWNSYIYTQTYIYNICSDTCNNNSYGENKYFRVKKGKIGKSSIQMIKRGDDGEVGIVTTDSRLSRQMQKGLKLESVF